MKRILMILLIVFMFSTREVLAKEIIIDGTRYDDSKDIQGDGFYFNCNSKVLYLDGYNGGEIVYDSILQLRLTNENIINGKENNGINCKELSVYGNGILNIYNADVGINCDRLQVQLSNVYITKCNTGINTKGIEIYLYMMNLVIEECVNAINSSDNIYIGSTKVNVINCDYGIYGDWLKTLVLNNSILYIKTRDCCLYNIQIVDSLKSKVVLESGMGVLNGNNINENDSNIIYVSNNKEDYFIDSSYYFYPHLKLATKSEISDLLINDEGLIIEVDKSFLEVDNNDQNDDLDEEIENNEKEDDEEGKGNKDENEDIENDKENNDALEIITKNEYTEDEFPDLEITNPNTSDNILIFILMFFISTFICGITLYIRRKNG